MRALPVWLLAAAIAGVSIACDTTPAPTTPDFQTPTGVWRLQTLETPSGVVVVVVPDPAKYTLELREDGNTHVVADCNVCNGAFTIGESGDTTFDVGLMACTLAACPPGSLHDDYLAALGSVTTWKRSAGELVLTSEQGALRFR